MEADLTDPASIFADLLESTKFDDSLVPPFPSRYKSIILARPDLPNLNLYLHTDPIRIAILDSYSKGSSSSEDPLPTAAMVVPLNREADWIFSTEEGQRQLLRLGAPGIARFMLIGNDPSSEECSSRVYTRQEKEELLQEAMESLYRFLLHFLPKWNIGKEYFLINFLRYEDNLVNAVVRGKSVGQIVGEMLVEDVEIEGGPGREFRRRMRFKRMPNLVQTEIKIVPETSPDSDSDSLSLRDMKFRPDLSDLVHVYLAPMAASLFLISDYLQSRLDSKIRPRAVCLGSGGGSLVGFLVTQLDFKVMCVEIDPAVWIFATKHFGLKQCEKESVRVCIADAIDFLKGLKNKYDTEANSYKPDHKFDVIMVDLDPPDFSDLSLPPMKFQCEEVISAAKCALSDSGLMALNVISETYMELQILILQLRAAFVEIYQIDSGNGQNVVLIATMSSIDLSNGVPANEFSSKLNSLKLGEFVEKMEKI